MHQAIGRHLTNVGLVLLLTILLTIPFWTTGYLIMRPEIQGRVAGSQISLDFELYPNLIEFSDYVSFSPQKVRPGLVTDNLILTYFPGQVATYHQLYQVYNPNRKPLYLKAVWAGREATLPWGSQLILALQPSSAPTSTRLVRPAPIGTTLLTLAEPGTFSPLAKKIVLEDRLLDLLNLTENQAVVVPLKEMVTVSESLYPESIVAKATQILWPQTQWVQLKPGEKAVVTAIVFGYRQVESQTARQLFTLPLTFEASFTPQP